MRNLRPTFASILLSLTMAGALFAEPQPSPAIKEMRAVSGGVELFVRVAGNLASGNVLLTVNGGPGVSSRYMSDLDNIAGPSLAVVTFDQRGIGRSSRLALDASQFTLEKYIEDMEAIRRALGCKSFHLLGHSWGGVLALKYAAVHPDRVDSLILIGNGPLRHSRFMEVIAQIRKRVIELMHLGLIDPKLPRHSDIYPAYFSDPRFKPNRELITDLDEQIENLTLETIAGFDLHEEAAGINKNVLILWGRDDPVRLDVAEDTKAALSGCHVELVVIEKCGHYWHERPEEFYKRILAFILGPSSS